MLQLITLFSILLYSLSGAAQVNCEQLVHGDGSAVYHSNHRLLTNKSADSKSAWFHSNGKLAAQAPLTQKGFAYYSNGNILSFHAGLPGATWYWPNGKVLSYSMGTPGAIWYSPTGFISKPQGPAMTTEELWLLACEMVFNRI